MTDTKFTPGPWEVFWGEPGDAPGIDSASCRSVIMYGTPDENMLGVKGDNIDEAHANAHLIAAAPDLHKALERCLSYIENTENLFGIELPCGIAAREALAKARGKQ